MLVAMQDAFRAWYSEHSQSNSGWFCGGCRGLFYIESCVLENSELHVLNLQGIAQILHCRYKFRNVFAKLFHGKSVFL